MNISELATKPKLVQLEVDSQAVIEQIGEPITFYMNEHLELGTYFDFYKIQQTQDMDMLMTILRKIIRNENGEVALQDDEILPADITLEILTKINEYVGKPKAKASMKKTGKVQS
jgi:hypothetical protein